jgi:hypothetical protein
MTSNQDLTDSTMELNHDSKMAVYLLSDLTDADLAALTKIAFAADTYLAEGAIVYVGIENVREMWSNFSDGFFSVIANCQAQGYEWLRFCP